MGDCFSKNTSTTVLTPTPRQFELKSDAQQPQNTKNEQQVFKKEIFVIKHRISHEIDRHPDEDDPNALNPSATAGDGESGKAGGARVRTSSCSKEEVDAILIQCGRLSRSASTGAANPNRRRRYSGSKRSFDFDLDMGLKNDDDDDEALNHHHRHRQQGSRVSSPSSRRSSRERDPRLQRSGSKERGSGSGGGRRVSISPSRRSESPFRNSNGGAASGGGSNRPVKMVSVPATDKSNNAGSEQVVVGAVKRIHVKRNVGDPAATVVSRTTASPRSRSPARTNLRVFSEDQSQEQRQRQQSDMREADHLAYRRKSLAEIDNNAARSAQPSNRSKEQHKVDEAKMVAMVPASVENLKRRQNITRTWTSRLSRDLDINPETTLDPSPPSYASLLLEDIHNFHQKNTNAAATAPPAFSLPACVSKACSIMEAVADLNSTTSSLFSEDRWRNPTPIERQINKDSLVESETVVNDDLMEPSLHNYVTVRRGVSAATDESSGSNSFASSQHLNRLSPSWEPNSADPTTRVCEVNPLGEFQRKLQDYPRKGIGRGRRRAYSRPNSTTVA